MKLFDNNKLFVLLQSMFTLNTIGLLCFNAGESKRKREHNSAGDRDLPLFSNLNKFCIKQNLNFDRDCCKLRLPVDILFFKDID